MTTTVLAENRYDVLLVEDDKIQCEEMARFLARSGITVGMAFTGLSAISQAAVIKPRVAMLDYNLPDMTGIALAARLRPLLTDTAILMMSGRIEGLSEEVIRSLGITVFVNKPVPLVVLRQAVFKMIKSGPSLSTPRTGWLTAGLGGTR